MAGKPKPWKDLGQFLTPYEVGQEDFIRGGVMRPSLFDEFVDVELYMQGYRDECDDYVDIMPH